MKTPTFHQDGQPSEDTLTTIETWKFPGDVVELFNYAKEAYNKHYGRWQIIVEYTHLEPIIYERFTALIIATGGWSNNETVISSLKQNLIWGFVFVAEIHGGLYILNYDKIMKLTDEYHKSIR